MRPRFLLQEIFCGCGAQDDIADCEKVASASGPFWPSGGKLDFVAIQFNVQTPLDSISMLLAMEICVHNIEKGEQEIKNMKREESWRIVVMPIYKLGKFVITYFVQGVWSLQKALFQW